MSFGCGAFVAKGRHQPGMASAPWSRRGHRGTLLTSGLEQYILRSQDGGEYASRTSSLGARRQVNNARLGGSWRRSGL